MSQIESIYSPQVEKQLQTIYSELEKHQKKVLELSKMSVDFYGGKTASSPKDLGKVANDMAKIEKQAERNRLAEIKLMQAREKAFDRFEKTYQKEQMQLKASENLYNKVQAKLNSLQNSYKGLATKKELGIKLTTNEEKKYISLQNKIQKYDTTLKAVDGTMGKNQRNVGNYASAFNPLTNSITQLSREMPAFANSFQTGFMAISNNLPIFFDAMQQVIVKTKALQAEGKPTKSVLSQLATSFFSVQTLLSVGVTLLTIYGDELLDMVLNTKEAKKATEEHTKALEHKEQVERNYTEAIRDNASEEITRSKLLFENAKNVNLSMKDRLKAINDLRERYPDYLKNLTDQEILAGNTADAETRLNEALIKRGIALAIQDKIKEKYKELTDQIIELEKTQNSLNIVENENDKAREKKNKLLKESKNINDLLSKTEKEDLFIKRELVTSEKILNKEKEETSKKTNKIKSEIQTLLDIYNKYSSFLDIVNEGQKNNNNLRDEEIKKIKEITGLKIEENKAIDVNLESIESQIENYERLKKAREDDAEALKKWSEEYRKGFQDDFISNSGFDKIFFIIENFDKLKESGVDTALAISEAFQQTFNTIAEASQGNFDREYERLAQQKELALKFAGESATAREEIEIQSEAKRKEIARREAEAQKRLAIFNIAINTAQGVISALASTPPNVPLSIAIGVIGAVQAGIVASQQIPQFWKGTENAPEGYAWTQERGAEIITDKKGNIKTLGSKKGAELTYLEKGDKVFTAEKTKGYLNGILQDVGISPLGSYANVQVQQNTHDFSNLENKISNLASAIKNQDKTVITVYKDKTFTRVGGKELQNARVEIRPRKYTNG